MAYTNNFDDDGNVIVGSAADTMISELVDVFAFSAVSSHSLVESVQRDLAHELDAILRGAYADRVHPLDITADELYDMSHQSIDNGLIYTSDIIDYWIEANYPEPYDMGRTINESMTHAVYEFVREHIAYSFDPLAVYSIDEIKEVFGEN